MGNDVYQNVLAGVLLPIFVCSAATIDLPYVPLPLPQVADADFPAFNHSFPDWKNRAVLAMTTDENFAAAEKMEIIVSFARHLVAESRDLEPEYAKVVDKKFWDLI